MFPKLIIRQMKSKHGRGRTLKKGCILLSKGVRRFFRKGTPLWIRGRTRLTKSCQGKTPVAIISETVSIN